jgi:predicted Zn-dependent protease with MMP-like domain
MALALDPDDPETLSAAADFYINVLPPKRRETTLVGLEYARRGRARAVTRRARNKPLRARLSLLEAQALNDLGRADEAIPRVDESLKLAPDMLEAKHELGVSLFNLCRFDDAKEAFAAVLRLAPEDPYAHHHLGLIYERIGRDADADAHFARARELSPDEFWAPVLLEPAAFEAEVAAAVAELPAETRALLTGVTVEVVDLPALDDLTAVDPPFSPTILGLFRGLPHGVEPPSGERASVPPRAIVLYRKNLARAVKTREELDRQIRRTLIHEVGHLSGLDEDDLRRRGLD